MTCNYKTSRAAHQRLDEFMMRECEKATKIDYGLKMLPDTVLHIANDQEFRWLLQPELKAIKDGLKYGSIEGKTYYDVKWIYNGYLNS